MTEFLQEVAGRLDAARHSLEQARLEGDDYLIQIRTGEIESLQRLFDEHSGREVIDLAGRAPATVVVDAPTDRAAS